MRERIVQQLLGMCPTHGPAAPNRRAGARRAATPDDPARRRIAGARGVTDDAHRSPAGRSRAHFGTMSAATVPRMWSGFNSKPVLIDLSRLLKVGPRLTFEPVTATPGLTQVGTQGGVVSLFFMRYEGLRPHP